jgi:hypothetical protein
MTHRDNVTQREEITSSVVSTVPKGLEEHGPQLRKYF